jgi:hypothetical protein
MVDDRTEDTPPLSDANRPKRSPPTIDLEATEVSGPADSAEVKPDLNPEPVPEAEPVHEPVAAEAPKPVSPWIVSVLSGAVAAALVIGVGWMLGWPPVLPATAPEPQVSSAAIDGLAARIAGVESKTSKPVAADPMTAGRIETLEKSVASLRGELTAARAQSDKLAAAMNDLKSVPGTASSSPPDLSEINERMAQIEKTARAQRAEIAQADARPADDLALRRVVVSSLLDVYVRQGEPYASALAAAKPLAENADALKPLDGFAASGVPGAAALSRELLALAPKLAPPAAVDNATTGSGVIDRLQAGATRLLHIERTDATGGDRGAVVARVTAAALRNDTAEARRELKALAPADRAAAQGWLEKADARDAALAAARQFADNAMATLAKTQP